MAAERVPESQPTAEIVYLVVPPYAQRAIPRTPSILDRVHYSLWKVLQPSASSELGRTVRAMGGAVGIALLLCVGLYVLYYLKSILGIDLFPDKHLEDFVPIPGYHRW